MAASSSSGPIDLNRPNTFWLETLTHDQAKTRLRIINVLEDDGPLSPRTTREQAELAAYLSGDTTDRKITRRDPGQFYFVQPLIDSRGGQIGKFQMVRNEWEAMQRNLQVDNRKSILTNYLRPIEEMSWYREAEDKHFKAIMKESFTISLRETWRANLLILEILPALRSNSFVFPLLLRLYEQTSTLYDRHLSHNDKCMYKLLDAARSTWSLTSELYEHISACGGHLEHTSPEFFTRANELALEEMNNSLRAYNEIVEYFKTFITNIETVYKAIEDDNRKVETSNATIREIQGKLKILEETREIHKTALDKMQKERQVYLDAVAKEAESTKYIEETTSEFNCVIFSLKSTKLKAVKQNHESPEKKAAYDTTKAEVERLEKEISEDRARLYMAIAKEGLTSSELNSDALEKAGNNLSIALTAISQLKTAVDKKKREVDERERDNLESRKQNIVNELTKWNAKVPSSLDRIAPLQTNSIITSVSSAVKLLEGFCKTIVTYQKIWMAFAFQNKLVSNVEERERDVKNSLQRIMMQDTLHSAIDIKAQSDIDIKAQIKQITYLVEEARKDLAKITTLPTKDQLALVFKEELD